MANLPYNVAVPVLLHLLATFDSWSHGLVMVQAEVADRLAADRDRNLRRAVGQGGLVRRSHQGRDGVADSLLAGTERRVWPGGHHRRPQPVTTATRDQVFAVVDAAFAQRRKMLRSALAGLAGSSAAASSAVVAAGLDPKARGETLDVTTSPDRGANLPGVANLAVMASSPPPVTAGTRASAGQDQPRPKVGAPRADGYHPLATVYQRFRSTTRCTRHGPIRMSSRWWSAAKAPIRYRSMTPTSRTRRQAAGPKAWTARFPRRKLVDQEIDSGGRRVGWRLRNGAAALLACAVLWDLDVTPTS